MTHDQQIRLTKCAEVNEIEIGREQPLFFTYNYRFE